MLTNPRTPSRFPDAQAFGNYLSQIWNAQVASSAAKARAMTPHAQFDTGSSAYEQQRLAEHRQAEAARNSIPAWIKQY